MKTLKISENKALELYKTGSNELKQILEESFGLEFFKPKLITDIVYDLDSLIEYLDIDEGELYIFRKPKNAFEKYINACSIIPKIVNIYNEGTILDWNDTSIYKYLPYIKKVGSGWVVDGAAHCWVTHAIGSVAYHYKTRELCLSGIENFKQIYLDFYTHKG